MRNVERILQMRRFRKLKLEDLGKLHIPMNRAKYFVITADHNVSLNLLDSPHLKQAASPKHEQLELFSAVQSARVGEL